MPDSQTSPNAVLLHALQDTELQWALLDHMEEGVYIVDRERRILYWNTGAERISGYSAMEVTGRFCRDGILMHCDVDGNILCGGRCPLAVVVEHGGRHECAVFLRHKQGHRVPVRVRSRAIHTPDGAVAGAMEVFEATSPPHLDIAHIEGYGCCDELTGLANRAYGEMKVGQAIEALEKFGLPFGWAAFALDGAEEMAHRHGSAFVDAATVVIARTLHHGLGPLDLLIRWSGAGFRALVRRGDSRVLLENARRSVILAHGSQVVWWGDSVHVTLSAGIAPAERGDTLESLESHAVEALEASRSAGGNRACLQHPSAVEFAPVNPFPMI